MHSVDNTVNAGLHRHPRANRNFIAIVQKEAYLCERKEGIEYTLCFLMGRGERCPINPDRDSHVNIYVHKPD